MTDTEKNRGSKGKRTVIPQREFGATQQFKRSLSEEESQTHPRPTGLVDTENR